MFHNYITTMKEEQSSFSLSRRDGNSNRFLTNWRKFPTQTWHALQGQPLVTVDTIQDLSWFRTRPHTQGPTDSQDDQARPALGQIVLPHILPSSSMRA
jgi:hypothetical protein